MTGKLGLPKREFESGAVHFAAPWGAPGVLCGARGKILGAPAHHPRVRPRVNCDKCNALVAWIWKHQRGQGFGERRAAKSSKNSTPA